MTSEINELNKFLKKHSSKGDDITHTRIGDKKQIWGGSYNITPENYEKFTNLYIHNIIQKKGVEYLTEKQIENGPILVDFDFRYESSIISRQHNEDYIMDIMDLYLRKLKNILEISDDVSFPIFIFEKPSINVVKSENIVKDGIHMIIGLSAPHNVQLHLRSEVLKEIGEVWGKLPVTNDWDSVLDRGISAGYTNWQLFGSRKPHNQAYELTNHFVARLDLQDNEFELDQLEVKDFDYKYDFKKLSARYDGHPKFAVKEHVKELLNPVSSTKKKRNTKLKLKLTGSSPIKMDEITNAQELDSAVEQFMNAFKENSSTYFIKETHDYAMVLPESYYGAGSYDKWLRVGMALHDTDYRLFISWIKFSSQSSTFDYADIPGFYDMWKKFGSNKKAELTSKSILYWAFSDSKDKYLEVYRETLDHYIDITVRGDFITNTKKDYDKNQQQLSVASQCGRDYDVAVVLYQMFKHEYVCCSVNGKGKWYKFQNHRWVENEEGWSLRLALSEEMYKKYQDKVVANMEKVTSFEEDDPRWNAIRNRTHNLAQCCQMLKKSSHKDNILKEAKSMFYDSDFLDKQDQNPYLLCFNNGVYDFKEDVFRDGRPEDYLSKSTNINYIPLKDVDPKISKNVYTFIEQLFPVKELRDYMWQHLSSSLIGTNENQTFNIYTGSGRNGKSMLTALMSKALGDYKGTVPITLITQKRNGIGGTSSEVVQLKGLRYAVMQEPTKGDKINEGIMKELTGGDPIQGRALYKDMITFVPHFKLVVCTNTLFDINSNDDGTWRRIRVCDFMAKFKENPVNDDEDEPYQYKVDKKLEEKFDVWSEVFMAKMVDIASKTKGNVEDCDIVMSKSNEYRDGQDYLSEFVKENIEKSQDSVIKKDELYQHFSTWYKEHYGRMVPKGKEIFDFMNNKFGKCKKKQWNGVKIVYVYDDEEDAEA